MKNRLMRLALLLLALSPVNAWALDVDPLQPTRFLNFNGVKIAVYQGPGCQGPGILLVHGNTASANHFAKVLKPLLTGSLRIAAIDLPGFGRSDNAPAYSAGYFANAIAFSATQLGLDKGVIVGWSLGGDLVLQASNLLPNAKGYFLVGTAPFGFAPDLPAPLLTPEESPAGQAVNFGFVAALPPALVDAYVTAFFRPGYNGIAPFLFADGQRTDPATRGAVGAAAAGLDPTFRDEVAAIKSLTVPVALVVGNEDSFVNPAFLGGLAPQIPNLWQDKVITVPNTGHDVAWERPLVFTLLLDAFVRHVR